MFATVCFSVTVIFLLYIYLRGKYNESYWKKRGVVFYKKNSAGGPYWQFLVENKSFFQILREVYDQFEEEPVVGLGSFLSHALYVKDPKNILHVLQQDFQSFNHRGIPLSETDILSNNVLIMNGPKWKLVRQKLTPLFTAAKLRNMYYIIDKSAQDLVDFLKRNPEKLKKDTNDTLTRFCNAAIASAVFGIGTESSFESPFHDMVKHALVPNFWKNVRFAIAGVSELLFKVLRLKLFGNHEKFFIGMIKQVIRKREKMDAKTHDFPELCVNLQKNGKMRDSETGLELEPTDEFLAAQAFFFFLAGVDPTAAGIFGLMIELGRHPEIQKRACKEVDAIFEKYNGQLTYDAIFEMEYLNKLLDESLRMYPPISGLTRRCVQKTVLPVGNIRVDKGTKIFTPIYEIHRDPKYYTNPDIFDPERFSRDGITTNDPVYMPFGKGNRICIGARYAKLQVLSAVVHMLRHYTMNTVEYDGGMRYSKEQVQVRLSNIDVELIPRKL